MLESRDGDSYQIIKRGKIEEKKKLEGRGSLEKKIDVISFPGG